MLFIINYKSEKNIITELKSTISIEFTQPFIWFDRKPKKIADNF